MPRPVSPRKKPLDSDTMVLPGADGIITGASAAVAAMPRRASTWLVMICDCSPAICDPIPAVTAWSWPTLAASVGLTPAATLVMRRSLPTAPTETVFGADVTDPAPRAIELACVARAPWPIATAFWPVTVTALPIATALVAFTVLVLPNTAEPDAFAVPATVGRTVNVDVVAVAGDVGPLTVLLLPVANVPLPLMVLGSPNTKRRRH